MHKLLSHDTIPTLQLARYSNPRDVRTTRRDANATHTRASPPQRATRTRHAARRTSLPQTLVLSVCWLARVAARARCRNATHMLARRRAARDAARWPRDATPLTRVGGSRSRRAIATPRRSRSHPRQPLLFIFPFWDFLFPFWAGTPNLRFFSYFLSGACLAVVFGNVRSL